MHGETFEALKRFIETAPAAREAVRPLDKSAEVAVVLEGDVQARFSMETGQPQLSLGLARNPDFTLRLPARAVAQLTSLQSDDVGEHGVAFFSLVVSKDPETKVRIHVDAPTVRLLRGGYLGVLAAGGPKVAWWLLEKGIKNPKAAIDRLRAGR